jgi:hypothetical protein
VVGGEKEAKGLREVTTLRKHFSSAPTDAAQETRGGSCAAERECLLCV